MGLEFRGPIPIPDMVATENMKHQTVNSQTRVSLIWQWRGQRKRKMSKTEKVQGVETGKGGRRQLQSVSKALDKAELISPLGH